LTTACSLSCGAIWIARYSMSPCGSSAAEVAIRAAGLVPRAFAVPSPERRGTVVAQSPKAGNRVPRGTKIRINVSNGPGTTTSPPPPPPPSSAKVTVPKVVGLDQAAAQRLLNRRGLKSRVGYVHSTKPAGQVIQQSPTAGSSVARGTRVRMSVSLGPNAQTTTVPNVLGKDPATAKSRLEDAGFQVQTLTQTVSSSSQDGVVVDEQPSGGSVAPNGSVITIYVGRFSG
jgi:serine/threonine-protein kinase